MTNSLDDSAQPCEDDDLVLKRCPFCFELAHTRGLLVIPRGARKYDFAEMHWRTHQEWIAKHGTIGCEIVDKLIQELEAAMRNGTKLTASQEEMRNGRRKHSYGDCDEEVAKSDGDQNRFVIMY